VGWATDPQGPDIALTNGNRTITRTASRNWGCGFFSEPFTGGKVKVVINIDNDGSSDSLYMGIIETPTDEWPRAKRLNSELAVCVWKRTGDMHWPGSNNTNKPAKYVTGDELTFSIDMEERTMVVAKNGDEMHTFENLWASCTFSVCFGGSNQLVSITSVEYIGSKTTKLANRSVKVNSDKVFYHFPVNGGFFARNSLGWRNEKDAWVQISSDATRLRRITDKTGWTTHSTQSFIKTGRYYYEIAITKLPEGALAQVGFTVNDVGKEGPLVA
jgi:hypothetical protein